MTTNCNFYPMAMAMAMAIWRFKGFSIRLVIGFADAYASCSWEYKRNIARLGDDLIHPATEVVCMAALWVTPNGRRKPQNVILLQL